MMVVFSCYILGSLTNDDGNGNGNDNGKKTVALDQQNNNSACASRIFVYNFLCCPCMTPA